jgi:alpha-N-arabinofuranosidase
MAHADGWQWTPDLIWFNNLDSYGTPNYEVQKLYSNNPGTHVLPLTMNGEPVTGTSGLYASATKDAATGEMILKVVNASEGTKRIQLDMNRTLNSSATMTVLKNDDPEAVNSFDEATISPETSEIKLSEENEVEIAPKSLTIIRVLVGAD